MSQSPYNFPKSDLAGYGTGGSQNPMMPTGSLSPLIQNAGWIKLVGGVILVQGILICLTIFGAVVGWLPVWIGMCYFQAGSAFEKLKAGPNPQLEFEGVSKLALAIKIQAVLTLIGLIFSCIAMAFWLFTVIALFSAAAAGAR